MKSAAFMEHFLHFLLVYFLHLLLLSKSMASDVRIPPAIIEGPDKLIRYRTDTQIRLPCAATGTPKPEYEWLKNGEIMSVNSNNVQRSEADGSLTIRVASSMDEGYYQCQAFNSHGVALSATAFVQRAVFIPQGDVNERRYSARAGEGLKVACTQPTSIPPPIYSWSVVDSIVDKDPSSVIVNSRITIDLEGNLLFANLETDDDRGGKLYKCNAFNPNMDLTSGGSYSTIDITPGDPEDSAPELMTSSPSTVIVLEGQAEAKLKCFFSGNPTPTVLWGRNGGLKSATERNFKTELVFENVKQSDEGHYTCRASNYLQMSEPNNIFVDVQAAPRFTSEPRDVNVTAGESHTFICDVYAEPEATVAWLINGQTLNEASPGERLSISDDGRSLTVSAICRDCAGGRVTDLMVVQCNASNVHGYAFGSGYLNVLVPTTILTGPSPVHVEEETDLVDISCVGKTDDSTPMSTSWFRNNFPLYPESEFRISLLESSHLLINVTGLTLEQIDWQFGGTYKCVVTNGYSSAEAETQLTVEQVETTQGPEATVVPLPVVASMEDLWWVFLICALLLILLIVLLCCCICCRKNKGEEYKVDEKERLTGNDPEKELRDMGFKDYQRPVDDKPVKASRNSLPIEGGFPEEGDNDSLDQYGDIDASGFDEDGSYIGTYKEERRRSQTDKY